MISNKFVSILIKVLVSLAVLGIAIFLVCIINAKNKEKAIAKDKGTMTVIIVNIDGEEVSHKELDFEKDSTVWDTLYNAYSDTIEYKEDLTYGVKLLGICGIETNFITSYLALYVNDVYSNVGLSGMELVDGMVLKIVETKL